VLECAAGEDRLQGVQRRRHRRELHQADADRRDQEGHPEARIRYVDQLDDPRDYRVNSDLIRRELGFKVTRRVSDGIREVMEVVRLGLVSDPDDQRYYNIPYKRPQ
jgi:hypothetical protein